jgi:hypothetical protein
MKATARSTPHGRPFAASLAGDNSIRDVRGLNAPAKPARASGLAAVVKCAPPPSEPL